MNIDAADFESHLEIRPLCLADHAALTALGVACFPGMVPWSIEQLEALINQFPEGQIGVFLDGELVASSSALLVDFDEYAEGHTWQEVSGGGTASTHDPDGDTLYGLEIMVDPSSRGQRLARRLYAARKNLCRERNLRRIVIGGRIPGYGAHADQLTAREYVDKVVARELHDPVLTTQLGNNFVLKRLIPNYLVSDEASRGWATLLEWSNLDYQPTTKKRWQSAHPIRICVVQYQMRAISSFEDFARQCEYFVDVAGGYRSDFVVFPEIFTMQLLSYLPPERPGEAVRRLAELTPQYLELFTGLAVKHAVNIVGGSHFVLEDGKLLNVSYLFQRDGKIGRQPKLHVTPSERRWWGVEPGHEIEVFDTDAGKVAIQICYDVEFPELARLAAEKGAEILFVPFCTDERAGYLRVRTCAQARAIENQIYVAIAGTVGNLPQVENMDIQYAQSGIFTPSDLMFARDGIAAECSPNVETVVIHDVDLEVLDRSRRSGTVRNWNDRRRDLYEVRYKGGLE